MQYFEITVTGRGEFPIDMLRHAQAWPVGTDDAEKITAPRDDNEAREKLRRRDIRLGTYQRNAYNLEAVGERFASFGWTAELTAWDTAGNDDRGVQHARAEQTKAALSQDALRKRCQRLAKRLGVTIEIEPNGRPNERGYWLIGTGWDDDNFCTSWDEIDVKLQQLKAEKNA